MSSPDSALKAFYQRASTDTAMRQILGVKPGGTNAARIVEGFPHDTLQKADTPRMTYFMASPSTRAKGHYSVRLQADGFFWPHDGFAQKRQDWTNRMLELFDEASWTYRAEARLYSLVITPGRDMPSGPEDPMRRMIELRIEVSPA